MIDITFLDNFRKPGPQGKVRIIRPCRAINEGREGNWINDMESIDDAVSQLLKDMSEAKMWAAEYQKKLEAGANISHEINKADKKIEELEAKAKKILKKLGCVNPKTRSVYNGMAGMLINWQEFKDNLE